MDWARVLAAQVVLLGHMRNEFLPALKSLPHAPLWLQALAFVGGFASAAVTVFFVISGLQVGGQIMQGGRSLRGYAIDRAARFLCVLLPLLLISRLFHELGWIQVSGSVVGWYAALINLVSLQTVIGPQYAENYPLWSLANEWCYYFVIPALWLGWRRRDRRLLAGGLGLLAFYASHVGMRYNIGGLLWFLAAIGFARDRFSRLGPALLALAAAFGFMLLERFLRLDWLMLPTGLCFLLSCHGLSAHVTAFGARLLHWQKHTFSLYVLHVPLIFVMKHQGLRPVLADGLAGFVLAWVAINLAAGGFYWLFERRYVTVRAALRARWSIPR